MKKVLVTGAFGQIGSELVPVLQDKYGVENVIAVGHRNVPSDYDGVLERFDVTDGEKMSEAVRKHKITEIYHLVSLLSAKGEENPDLAWKVNMDGLKLVLDLARELKIKLFWPSSIAVFGPTTPRVNTPQRTVLEPTTMYGVTKLSGENLCHYYYLKYGVDVRSVRYPGLISWKAEPGGGTTDYAVDIFYKAIESGKYECFLKADSRLPMMYMDDAVEGTVRLMEVDGDKVKIRTSYNMAAISFTPEEIAKEINKQLPLEVTYKPDHRQKIADSWPESIDDNQAREDWGFAPKYDLSLMVEEMIKKLKTKLSK